MLHRLIELSFLPYVFYPAPISALLRQGGVTYEHVTFRFFPGSTDMNDYNIKRNHYYTMSVTLKGIDVTDQRITVGTIPPIDTGGLQPMPAGKGGDWPFLP